MFRIARERDPEASLVVSSDHGMTPVTNHTDLVGEVAKLGLRMPQDYLAVYDSTMARFWFFNETARARVHQVDAVAYHADRCSPKRRCSASA